MQDSRCKPYEESANVVIRQIEQDEGAATDSMAGDGTEANVSDHHTNDVGLEPPVVDVSQSLMFAFLPCCSAVSIVVELSHVHLFINFSFMQETSHNVEDAVDCGVNDPFTDKCKVIFILLCLYIFLNFHAHQCALHVQFPIPHR